MIPVKELMVGDYVRYDDRIVEVAGVDTTQKHDAILILDKTSEIGSYYAYLEDLEPILVNIEMIEKLGFELHNDYFPWYSLPNISVSEDWDSDLKQYYLALSLSTNQHEIELFSVYYLHQMQNIINICNVETPLDFSKLFRNDV